MILLLCPALPWVVRLPETACCPYVPLPERTLRPARPSRPLSPTGAEPRLVCRTHAVDLPRTVDITSDDVIQIVGEPAGAQFPCDRTIGTDQGKQVQLEAPARISPRPNAIGIASQGSSPLRVCHEGPDSAFLKALGQCSDASHRTVRGDLHEQRLRQRVRRVVPRDRLERRPLRDSLLQRAGEVMFGTPATRSIPNVGSFKQTSNALRCALELQTA